PMNRCLAMTQPAAAILLLLSLKDQLQTELQLAHITARVADLAEGAIWQVGVGITPDRVVQEIECFEAKLQVRPLVEMEVFEGGKIPVRDTWPDDGVAAHIAERVRQLSGKSACIKPLKHAALVAGQRDSFSGGVGTVEVGADIRNVSVIAGRQREPVWLDRDDVA